jgi:hypothetical protein
MKLTYNVFKALQAKKPVDFRNVLASINECIKEHRHCEFEFLYNKYIVKKDYGDNRDNSDISGNKKIIVRFIVKAKMTKNKFALKILMASYH